MKFFQSENYVFQIENKTGALIQKWRQESDPPLPHPHPFKENKNKKRQLYDKSGTIPEILLTS